jgi:hypothetical protein
VSCAGYDCADLDDGCGRITECRSCQSGLVCSPSCQQCQQQLMFCIQ